MKASAVGAAGWLAGVEAGNHSKRSRVGAIQRTRARAARTAVHITSFSQSIEEPSEYH